MIKFTCQCSKRLGVPDVYAGKRVKCPSCGSAAIVPLSKEPKIIEPVEDEKAGADTELGGSERRSIWTDDLLAKTQPVAGVEKNDCPQCGYQVSMNRDICPRCHYSFVPDVSGVVPEPSQVRRSPLKLFFGDALKAICLVRSVSEAVTLVMAVCIYLLTILLSYAPVIGIIGTWIIHGYICVYLFQIMLETANGEMELSSLPFADMGEIRAAFLRFMGSFLYACGPIMLIGVLGGYWMLGPESLEAKSDQIILWSIAIGLFIWPMAALCMALGDTTMIRPDKVVMSIIRTAGPYMVCCVMMYAAYFLSFTAVGEAAWLLPEEPSISTLLVSKGLLQAGGLMVQIMAMRLIGTFYKHYKDKIDW